VAEALVLFFLRIWGWVIDRNQASLMGVVTEKSKKKKRFKGVEDSRFWLP